MNTARAKDERLRPADGHVPKAAIEASKALRDDPSPKKDGEGPVLPVFTPPKADRFSEEKVSDALPDEVVEAGIVDRNVEPG